MKAWLGAIECGHPATDWKLNIYQRDYENTLTVITIVKNLIKNKVHLYELEHNLSASEKGHCETLINESQACLKNIKKNIKEKSAITKKFREKLTEEQRQELKVKVADVSALIKQLENDLKQLEAKLCAALSAEDEAAIPLQFKPQEPSGYLSCEKEPTFSVITPRGDFSEGGAYEWKTFLSSFPSHSTYHRPEWLNVLSEYSGYDIYLFILKVDGKIVAGMPVLLMTSKLFGRRMISLPYVNYGGVLSYSKRMSEMLLCNIKDWTIANSIDFTEIRTTIPGLEFLVQSRKCSMILQLPENDGKLEKDLGAKTRAQYKKAAANNPQIMFGGEELLDDFYYVFSINMRDLGTPVYSKSIFSKILRKQGIHSFICIVKIDSKPVSVAFLTGYRDMLEVPWASTLKTANKYNANMWMYRMILKKAIELDYRYFDFGRSTKNANTYKFKKQWGAKPVEHFWYYLTNSTDIPETNPDNPKYKFAIAIWKRLPIWFTNLIGPFIVKKLP